jgi:flavorubredoxin
MDEIMDCKVSEIAPRTYRLSTFLPDFGIQFNQILIDDDEPFMMHTGFRSMFAAVRKGVAKVMDPGKLRWIGFSHFESDECGAMNDWLGVAPKAQAVASQVAAMVNLGDFTIRPSRGLADGEVLATGKKRIRFLATPHLPHGWDAGLFFEETEKVLLCSDLFFQPSDPEPLIESGIAGRARAAIEANLVGPLAHDLPYTAATEPTMRRLADLSPKVLATMHGSSFRGDCKAAILDLAKTYREVLAG